MRSRHSSSAAAARPRDLPGADLPPAAGARRVHVGGVLRGPARVRGAVRASQSGTALLPPSRAHGQRSDVGGEARAVCRSRSASFSARRTPTRPAGRDRLPERDVLVVTPCNAQCERSGLSSPQESGSAPSTSSRGKRQLHCSPRLLEADLQDGGAHAPRERALPLRRAGRGYAGVRTSSRSLASTCSCGGVTVILPSCSRSQRAFTIVIPTSWPSVP